MKVKVHPSPLKGTIHAPASKSSMQRALAAALLAKGRSVIHNPGHSNDDKAAIDIIRSLGAEVQQSNDELVINSHGVHPTSDQINCGESGLSFRMFTSIAAISEKELTINGTGSLSARPMDFFDQVLPQLEVKIKSNGGRLPIVLRGPLLPRDIEIDGSMSSQFLTGLLFAYSASPNPSKGGALMSNRSTVSINVRNLKSRPYIDLTLDVMKKFGMNVPENRNYEEFIFNKDAKIPPLGGGRAYTVEADWSSAALLLVAGAIAGPLTVKGLEMRSTQADKSILKALTLARSGISIEANEIDIHPAPMIGFEFDATECPDLFPPLVALAAYCSGITNIKGAGRLTHKESNRAETLQKEFGKMGVRIELNGDLMSIHGGAPINGNTVHSHHDHRIAMACAVAALKADGETIIEEAGVVSKSYPDFYNDLKTLGADVSLNS